MPKEQKVDRPALVGHRHVEEVRKAVESGREAFEERELAIDWRFEERRPDEDQRRREDYYKWSYEQQHERGPRGQLRYDDWRDNRATFRAAGQEAVARHATEAIELMRLAKDSAGEPPRFGTAEQADTYVNLTLHLREQVAAGLEVQIDSMNEFLTGARSNVRRGAHDLVRLFDKIREPIVEWGKSPHRNVELSYKDLAGHEAAARRGIYGEDPEHINELHPEWAPLGYETLGFSDGLIETRYEMLRKAVESFSSEIFGPGDLKSEIDPNRREWRYQPTQPAEVARKARRVQEEIESTVAAHSLVSRMSEKKFGNVGDHYMEAGAVVHLAALGEEIARQTASRLAEPTFVRVHDILAEDARTSGGTDPGRLWLKDMANPVKEITKALGKGSLSVIKDLPKNEESARNALKLAVRRTSMLEKALQVYEDALTKTGRHGGMELLADAAIHLAVESRFVRNLMEWAADGPDHRKILLDPLDALSAHVRGRLLMSLGGS